MSWRTYQKKLDTERRGIISGESRNSRSGFWKKLFPKNLENSQKNACDRVLIVTQTPILQFHYKKASNRSDSQNDYSVEYQRCI